LGAPVDSSDNLGIGTDPWQASHEQIRGCVLCKLLRWSEENSLSYRTTLSMLRNQTDKLLRSDPIYTMSVQESRTSKSKSLRHGELLVAKRWWLPISTIGNM
jgi:hypothetical protein